MTEAEWLTCDDLDRLLTCLRRKADKRKQRLFACARCYRIWSLIQGEASRAAVVAAEQFADGHIDDTELELRERAAKRAVYERHGRSYERDAANACSFVAAERVINAVIARQSARYAKMWFVVEQRGTNPERDDFKGISEVAEAEELTQQVALIRDIFGNPFRPVNFSPTWRTNTAVSLARQLYDTRDFSAMPILADALQDPSCDNEDILNHCRNDGPHVRGCWVCDLVLGKE